MFKLGSGHERAMARALTGILPVATVAVLAASVVGAPTAAANDEVLDVSYRVYGDPEASPSGAGSAPFLTAWNAKTLAQKAARSVGYTGLLDITTGLSGATIAEFVVKCTDDGSLSGANPNYFSGNMKTAGAHTSSTTIGFYYFQDTTASQGCATGIPAGFAPYYRFAGAACLQPWTSGAIENWYPTTNVITGVTKNARPVYKMSKDITPADIAADAWMPLSFSDGAYRMTEANARQYWMLPSYPCQPQSQIVLNDDASQNWTAPNILQPDARSTRALSNGGMQNLTTTVFPNNGVGYYRVWLKPQGATSYRQVSASNPLAANNAVPPLDLSLTKSGGLPWVCHVGNRVEIQDQYVNDFGFGIRAAPITYTIPELDANGDPSCG